LKLRVFVIKRSKPDTINFKSGGQECRPRTSTD
jgi:hypothetical protein